jgi:hypothetical protein
MQPQFHLKALTNPSDPDVVLLKLPICHQLELRLVTVRLVFFLANMVVLAAAVMSFQAWIKMDSIKFEATKGLPSAAKALDSLHVPHDWIHDHYSHLLSHGFAHADQILFACGVVLMSYYVVFGFTIPLLYGRGLTDLRFSVLAYPGIVVIAIAHLFVAVSFLELQHELNLMDCQVVQRHVSYMRMTAMLNMRTYMDKFATPLSAVLCSASIVMIAQGLVAFFTYDLPFQRKMDLQELVLSNDPKNRSVKSYKPTPEFNSNDGPNEHELHKTIPYRNLSAAFTVMLHLCNPEVRDFHRSI